MKKILLFVSFTLIVFLSVAQTPQYINYQAVARYSNTNIPIPYQDVTINFKIRQATANGLVVFDETQNTATDNCGLFNVKIGDVNKQAFALINWSAGNKFLEVTINNKISGTTQLVSVPYSLYAAKTLSADTAAYAAYAKSSGDWTNVGDTILYSLNKDIGIGTKDPEAPLDVHGFMQIKGDSNGSTKIQLIPLSATNDNWISSLDENENRVWVINTLHRGDNNSFGIYSQSYGYALNIATYGNVGIKMPASPSYALSVNGEVSVNGSGSMNCLTIKGGCDWYEEADAKDGIQAGEVAVINVSGSVNSVLRSRKAYDKTVVGVVSGAGGINPGIGLQQTSVLEGNTKIAMGGKVKVHVVGIVKPGDLLTSSDTQGCAMAVKNKKKAFGAVLGKALSAPDTDGRVLMQVMME